MIDEHTDLRSSGCSFGEDIETEVEGTILSGVVVRGVVRHCETCDTLTGMALDDHAQATPVIRERAVGRDVEIPAMGGRGMSDVRGGRVVEEVSESSPPDGRHAWRSGPGSLKSISARDALPSSRNRHFHPPKNLTVNWWWGSAWLAIASTVTDTVRSWRHRQRQRSTNAPSTHAV
jgi:hypothetical protein